MDKGKLIEYAGIILVGFLLLRWVSRAYSGMGGYSGLQQTWQPDINPYGSGGGVLYFQPTLTSPYYSGSGGGYFKGPRQWRGGQRRGR
jgi:hypothetical protein